MGRITPPQPTEASLSETFSPLPAVTEAGDVGKVLGLIDDDPLTTDWVDGGGATDGVPRLETDNEGIAFVVWEAPTQDRARMRWRVEDQHIFNGDRNAVMKFGYNIPASGDGTTGYESGEGSLFMTVESHYDNGSQELMEWHIEGTTNAGASRRPLSLTVDKNTGAVDLGTYTDTFQLRTVSGTQIFNTTSTAIFFNQNVTMSKATGNFLLAITGTAGHSILNINGAAANESRLMWSRGGTEAWYAYTTGSNDLRFRDITNGREHMKFVPGASVAAARTDVLATFRFNHADFFQTTVGAAGGASALPATPTKYLKVQDSAGATFVVPCYAAS